MKSPPPPPSQSSDNQLDDNLRQRAEGLLNTSATLGDRSGHPPSEADTLKVVHELQVYQIELIMQNNDLILAKERAEVATAKFVELYDFAPTGYFTLSREGEIIELNLCASQMLGMQHSKLINSRFILFVTNDTKPNFNSFLEKVFAGKTKAECDITLSINANVQMFVHLVGNVPDGEELCFVTAVDITARKTAEKGIIQARNQAEKSNRAKIEFLSRMSHELRTPMHSMLSYAQLLEMSELNPTQKKWVNHIFTSGKHLLNLIDEVLDISGTNAGKLSLLIEPVPLMGIIEEMMDTIQPLANAGQLKLELESVPANQLFVLADRKRLKQVLIHLLSNAIKFNRQGGSVTVKTERMPQTDAGILTVRISIIDTGLGISSDDLPKLFLPFGRIDAEVTNADGIGLGLDIVKIKMDAMKGMVGVESVYGVGSTFWIELPMVQE
jgi:PAS domain S-box-containing protein